MTNLFAALRLMRAVWVLSREGVIAALPRQGLSGPALTGHKLATWLASGPSSPQR